MFIYNAVNFNNVSILFVNWSDNFVVVAGLSYFSLCYLKSL